MGSVRRHATSAHSGDQHREARAEAYQAGAAGAGVRSVRVGAPAAAVALATAVAAAAVPAAAAAAEAGGGGIFQRVEEVAAGSGFAGMLVFGAAYAVSTVLFVPASALTLAAGYVYGPLTGTAVVSASSTTGAALAFLISRYLARPLVEKRLVDYPRFKAIDEKIAETEGARIVFLLRLSPLVPFGLLNYALGLTKVEFVKYVGASWIGMLPGTFAYVYLGSIGKATIDAASGAGADASGEGAAIKLLLYVVGGLATLAATTLVSRSASAALKELEEGQVAGPAALPGDPEGDSALPQPDTPGDDGSAARLLQQRGLSGRNSKGDRRL